MAVNLYEDLGSLNFGLTWIGIRARQFLYTLFGTLYLLFLRES